MKTVMEKNKILIVDDEREMRSILQKIAASIGYESDLCKNGSEAIKAVKEKNYDLVISDLKMTGKTGLDVLRATKKSNPFTPVIIITAFATVENAVKAMKEGVYDYILKPFSSDEIVFTIERALKLKKIEAENVFLREKIGLIQEENQLVGKSPVFLKIIDSINIISQNEGMVLITGESGTGKELIAQAIHNASKRRKEQFVAINCGSLNDNLLSSELFGHEKGAFTGAINTKKGLCEVANEGTLFLDEVGETSLAFQILLLRFLQDKSFRRVGGTKTLHADVRIIAATNKNLEAEAKRRRFRQDLYYRLNVIPIVMPPLRERKEDIPLLVQHFALKYSRKYHLPCPQFDSAAYEALENHDWPGNIRELENLVEHAVIMRKNTINFSGELTDETFNPFRKNSESLPLKEIVGQMVQEVERFHIKRTLKNSKDHRELTAEKLGISRRNLQYKIKKYGL